MKNECAQRASLTTWAGAKAAAEAARVARQRVFIMVAAVGAETSGKSEPELT